jgi:hypothetical protein
MNWKAFKYTTPIVIYALAVHAFFTKDAGIFLPLLVVWVGIPILELLFKPNPSNMDAVEEEIAKADKTYDYLLYMVVPMQYLALFLFLNSFTQEGLEGWMITGRVFVMGLLCGTFGINVGHELGHRTNRFEQQLAKALLLTSLYMHFYIEHNRGHHKRVSTPEDPSSAREGESVYAFYIRSIVGSYRSAWEISEKERSKKNISFWHPRNEMLMFQLLQIGFVGGIAAWFGLMTAVWFVGAAVIGFLLLIWTSPYRMQRVIGFMDPWADPYGKGYQLSHALIAFGRGEWFGVGLGASVEKLFYLPEAHTDFLLAVIAEELGFVGVLFIILLFSWLVWRAFAIGRRAIEVDRPFAALVAQGIGLWIGVQVIINMGVNMGVLPTKGLTLPLLSFGGSAILATCCALAVLMRVDWENRQMARGFTV